MNKIILVYLLLIPCLLYPNLSLYNDSYKIIMDNTYGTFTLLYPDKNNIIPLLDNKNEPFSSFAVLYINKKPYILGSSEGELLECDIDSNNIIYDWTVKGVNVKQELSLVQYEEENFVRIKYSFDYSGKNSIDFLIVLDHAECKCLCKYKKRNIYNSCMLKKQDDIILSLSDNLYQVEKISATPDCIIINNWENIYNNLNKIPSNPGIENNKKLDDTAIGFLWKDLQKHTDKDEIGLTVEKIKPEINSDSLNMVLNGPGIIHPYATKLIFTIQNNSLTKLDNITFINKNKKNESIKIISPLRYRLKSLKAFAKANLEIKFLSISPIEQISELDFELKFQNTDKVIHKDFKYDVHLKKYTARLDVTILETEKEYLFEINCQTNFYFEKANIVIEDPEEKIIKKLSFNAKEKIVTWDGKTDKDEFLIRGSYYFYYIEIREKDNLFKTSKKIFTTEIERIETEKQLTLRFPAINFSFGSAALKSYAYPILKKAAGVIQKNKDKSIRIEGHTDNIGDAESNLGLSLDRATAVKDYFVGVENIPEFLFKIKGWGDKSPIVANSTEENRARNRRVEIIIEK